MLFNSDAVQSKGSLAFNHGSETVFRYENRAIPNRKGECKPRLFVDKLIKHIDTAGEVMVADQYYITWATYNVYPCQCRDSFNLLFQIAALIPLLYMLFSPTYFSLLTIEHLDHILSLLFSDKTHDGV